MSDDRWVGRTGYWIGEATTSESTDDNPDGYCVADYDLCMIVTAAGKPLDVGCKRKPDHDGDHWDSTYGIFWRGRRATSKEWQFVRNYGKLPSEEVHAFSGWSTPDGKAPDTSGF